MVLERDPLHDLLGCLGDHHRLGRLLDHNCLGRLLDHDSRGGGRGAHHHHLGGVVVVVLLLLLLARGTGNSDCGTNNLAGSAFACQTMGE